MCYAARHNAKYCLVEATTAKQWQHTQWICNLLFLHVHVCVTSLPPAYCYCSCSLYCTLVLLRVTVLTSLYVITSQCTSGKLWRQSRSDDSLRRRWPACGPPWPAANTAVRPVSDVGAGVMSHGTGGPMTRACLTRGLTACSLSHTRSGS